MAPIVLAPWAEPVPGQTVPMSAQDLALLADDDWTYELVEGTLVRMPLAGTNHGGISMSLGVPLAVYVRHHRLGRVFAAETGFLLSRPGDPETVLGADVAFLSTSRLPAKPPEQAFWRVTPDLIAETASPSQFRPEIAAKVGIWLAAGVRLAWVVWPGRQQVDVWRPGSDEPGITLGLDDSLDGLDVVPGFALPVRELFE